MGDHIALDGNTLVIRVGDVVYIYNRYQGGDEQWGFVKKIDLSDTRTTFLPNETRTYGLYTAIKEE